MAEAGLTPPPPRGPTTSSDPVYPSENGPVQILIGLFAAAFISVGVAIGWQEGDWQRAIAPTVLGGVLAMLSIFWPNVAKRVSADFSGKARALAAEPTTWWISAMVLFCASCALTVFEQLPPTPRVPFSYVIQYGPGPGSNPSGVEVIADGNIINLYAGHHVANNYLLGVAAYHWDGRLANEDTEFTMKSSLREITRGPITIGIPWSDKFKREFEAGMHGTLYAFFLVPRDTKVTQYSTLNDVKRLGGLFLEGKSGGP